MVSPYGSNEFITGFRLKSAHIIKPKRALGFKKCKFYLKALPNSEFGILVADAAACGCKISFERDAKVVRADVW